MRAYPTLLLSIVLIAPGALAHPGAHEQQRRLSQAIDQQPAKQALYLQRGALSLESGNLPAAKADFTQAEKLGAPEKVAYHWALYQHQKGDFNSALTHINRYLKAFPLASRGYEVRAKVALSLNNFTSAAADLQHHIELEQQPHPGSYIGAADLLGNLGRPLEALALLDSGIARLGLTPPLQRKAIALEAERGDFQAAISRHRSLREPLNDNPGWKFEMAQLLISSGQPQAARPLLQALLLQLDELRANPAREALRKKALTLSAVLSATKH